MDMVAFENSFYEGRDEYKGTGNNDVFASITIDGYPEGEEKEGKVIAVVYITMHGDLVTDWHDNGYRMNETVLALIDDSKKQLMHDFIKWHER